MKALIRIEEMFQRERCSVDQYQGDGLVLCHDIDESESVGTILRMTALNSIEE